MSLQTLPRYHALDALRASMMLLGLVLHSAVSYTVSSLPEAWPYDDAATSTVFDLAVFFIHLFRMPVFFVVAGFFAALLYLRDGSAGFARNRAMRVLVPLAIFWVMVFPVVRTGFIFATGRAAGSIDWVAMAQPFADANLTHLWFLWYLVLLYVAALAVVPLAGRIPSRWREPAADWFAVAAGRWWGALVLGAVTTVSLLPMQVAGLDTSLSLLPPLRSIVAYGVFFAFGWLLFHRRDLLDGFGARWLPMTVVGGAVSVAYLVVTVGRTIANPTAAHVVGVTLAGVSMWFLIFGIIGVFIRKMHRVNPVVRYMSDAAYWMYLIHLPFTIWIPGVLAPVALPAVLKFWIVLTLTSFATIVSYHYLVRSTAIGMLLNGKRYPRGLPR